RPGAAAARLTESALERRAAGPYPARAHALLVAPRQGTRGSGDGRGPGRPRALGPARVQGRGPGLDEVRELCAPRRRRDLPRGHAARATPRRALKRERSVLRQSNERASSPVAAARGRIHCTISDIISSVVSGPSFTHAV